MTPLQITLITVLVLIFVVGMITYFMRGKYYEQIDELDRQKKNLFEQAPRKELKEASELSITGQSLDLRDKFEEQWNKIETVGYPELENYLFQAEQATDRYRLNESKKNQEKAQEKIKDIETETNNLRILLNELIEREQANLEKIDEIKRRYHEVRKSLLAYSFSFGPASESFEEKLNRMEEDFTKFSESTLSGDHEEGNKIIERLSDNIQETEEQMDQIPSLLETLNEEYLEDIKDLEQGYEQMIEHDYVFPENNILEEIEQLKEQKEQAVEHIRSLDLKEANDSIEELGQKIDYVYEKMEKEIEAEANVYEILHNVKQALYFLQEETRRLIALENRLAQSYVLFHNEIESLERIEEKIKAASEEYKLIDENVLESELAYSIAESRLNHLFSELEKTNNEKDLLADNLNSYRQEELRYRDEMLAMEEAMYDMKRALENERLPGLPEEYLELFFSTTRRIERLAEELARTKISLISVRKLHQISEEDVLQLSRMTEELIKQVNLIERSSQRLYHYKDEHKGILETIRYSESLFNNDYDYDTALRLLKEKLENVAPGVYQQLEERYEAENGL